MKYLKIAAVFPIVLGVFIFLWAWKKWHFGPSQRILNTAYEAKDRLFKWRFGLDEGSGE